MDSAPVYSLASTYNGFVAKWFMYFSFFYTLLFLSFFLNFFLHCILNGHHFCNSLVFWIWSIFLQKILKSSCIVQFHHLDFFILAVFNISGELNTNYKKYLFILANLCIVLQDSNKNIGPWKCHPETWFGTSASKLRNTKISLALRLAL